MDEGDEVFITDPDWQHGCEDPVTVIDIDEHQVKIDDGFDSRWVPIRCVTKA